jgi:hypothetical protein
MWLSVFVFIAFFGIVLLPLISAVMGGGGRPVYTKGDECPCNSCGDRKNCWPNSSCGNYADWEKAKGD